MGSFQRVFSVLDASSVSVKMSIAGRAGERARSQTSPIAVAMLLNAARTVWDKLHTGSRPTTSSFKLAIACSKAAVDLNAGSIAELGADLAVGANPGAALLSDVVLAGDEDSQTTLGFINLGYSGKSCVAFRQYAVRQAFAIGLLVFGRSLEALSRAFPCFGRGLLCNRHSLFAGRTDTYLCGCRPNAGDHVRRPGINPADIYAARAGFR